MHFIQESNYVGQGNLKIGFFLLQKRSLLLPFGHVSNRQPRNTILITNFTKELRYYKSSWSVKKILLYVSCSINR